MGEFILRVAEAEDADQLADLRVAAMRQSLEALDRFDPQRARNRFLKEFVPEQTTKLMREQTMLGFYVLKEQPDHFWLDHLYVRPEAQGEGLGAKALSHIKEVAFAKGKPVRLGALKQSRANEFYKGHGFKQTHETKLDNYYEVTPQSVFQLETATPQDFETLQHIRYTAMKESAEANGLVDHDKAREVFASEYAPDKTQKIQKDDKTIGFYVVLNQPDHLCLDMFYLLPEAQGSGLGSQILNQIKTQANTQNKPIRLDALRISRANTFYKRHGFHLTHSEGCNNYYEYTSKHLINASSWQLEPAKPEDFDQLADIRYEAMK